MIRVYVAVGLLALRVHRAERRAAGSYPARHRAAA
jgi:hypothetical protein